MALNISEEKFRLISSTGRRFELAKTAAPQLDTARCINCGSCVRLCPTSAITTLQREVCRICVRCTDHPVQLPKEIREATKKSCGSACPLGLVPQSYIALIANGKFKEALDLVKDRIPLPGICGRICHHPCEEECKRGGIDEPISIRALKRFLTDYEQTPSDVLPVEKTKPERVAIIGSGPAGLSAAYDLVRLGYGVTILEALPYAGGMLRLGIPAFRLPRDILDAEIDSIINLGIEIRYNTQFGKDVTLGDLFSQGYKAVFIAVGAHKSRSLGIKGEKLEGIFDCISFMRCVNLDQPVKVGQKVVVIGGGSIAVDVARTALRLGAKEVFMCSLETTEEMPAHSWEIDEAQYEGVKFHSAVSPVRFIGKDGKVEGVELIKVSSIKTDELGRLRPVTIKGSEFVLKADTVIEAIGQSPDLSFLKGESRIKVTKQGLIDVSSVTLATGLDNVFAGGDTINPKPSVIDAIASGKKGALSIDNYLRKRHLPYEYPEEAPRAAPVEEKIFPHDIEKIKRKEPPALPLKERTGNFKEVELSFTAEEATREAERCMKCGYRSIDQERCIGCGVCLAICPQMGVISMESLVSTRGGSVL